MQPTPNEQTREEFMEVARNFEEGRHNFVLTKTFDNGNTVELTFSTLAQMKAFAELVCAQASVQRVSIDSLSQETVTAVAVLARVRVATRQ